MRKLWQEVETILVNSRLRLPIYIITIILGVGFFIAPSIFVATFFVTFLGLLLIFESIHPTGYHLFYKFLTDFLPSKIQITIWIFLKILGIILGIFLMFIGIGVEIGRHL
ncbi:hypothetical protein [Peribacillus frigoritolerans]|uniref:hypothetical protein n=1 Tax=Peribacillus frigoritolerans TaxID=450367 RepID=UPI002EA2A185|nr:hypothetical protein [Peribacillus frigoritolerans]